MERVTNVFCGGGGGTNTNLQTSNANATPDKPSRGAPTLGNAPGGGNNKGLNNVTSNRGRMPRNRAKNIPLASGGTGGYAPPATWEQLVQDDHFLGRFFLYFNAGERKILAQVRQTSLINTSIL